MAEESDKLMLRLLRDIRAKQDDQDTRFDTQDKRLDELDKATQDWKETTATGVGLATHANIRTEAVERSH